MNITVDRNVWVVRAGQAGEASNLFLTGRVVALGWERLGDLSAIPADREAFKRAFGAAYPESKPGAIPVVAGQIYRFVHDLRAGDIVIYPSKHDRMIHIGIAEGPYQYSLTPQPGFPHQRQVRWVKTIPRTDFSQGALYETGSALTCFLVKNYADEFIAAMEGKVQPIPPTVDPTVAIVAEDIEETTRDFILKALARELKGHPFAAFIAHLLNAMGYRTRLSKPGPDGGIDIIAHRDELGFEPPIVKVQVKAVEGSVGDPVVSALYGKVSPNEFGLFVTLGTFTHQARAFAASKSNLRLLDGEELVELILQYYDQLDPRYKGLVPLKKVYVPESLE